MASYLLSESAAAAVRAIVAQRGGVRFAPRGRDFSGGGGESPEEASPVVPAVVTGSTGGSSPWTVTVTIYGNGLGEQLTEIGATVVVLPLARASVIPPGTLVLVSAVPLVVADVGDVV